MNDAQNSGKDPAFKSFAIKRITISILICLAILWLLTMAIGFLRPQSSDRAKLALHSDQKETEHSQGHESQEEKPLFTQSGSDTHGQGSGADSHEAPKTHLPGIPDDDTDPFRSFFEDQESDHQLPGLEPIQPEQSHEDTHAGESGHEPAADKQSTHQKETHAEKEGEHGISLSAFAHKPKGVAFLEACIHPLKYELEERFWGWRPNDLINVTDNVNNFQRGVLEVTRRTVVILTERISRTGSSASFDENLERAMNWFMVKSDKYWFPSAESKYTEGLDELTTYLKKLEKGEAHFYTRIDNLIPLLTTYEDLLGSCDETLVKTKEKNGEEVSFFRADDYFYYSKGVVSAMSPILEALHHEFHATIDSVQGLDILHHAIVSCHHANAIEPWLILESDPSGIFANHRANLAAPISHARFYLGLLIKALTT